jgi:hypothetical protein
MHHLFNCPFSNFQNDWSGFPKLPRDNNFRIVKTTPIFCKNFSKKVIKKIIIHIMLSSYFSMRIYESTPCRFFSIVCLSKNLHILMITVKKGKNCFFFHFNSNFQSFLFFHLPFHLVMFHIIIICFSH